MEAFIKSIVPTNYAIFWVLMLILTVYVVIKIAPKIIKGFNSIRQHVNNLENLESQIGKNSEDIKDLKEKISRDYSRLNSIEFIQEQQQKFTRDSLEERELILRSLLGVVQGLQEIGANGPTKKTEKEIQEYLLRKSHESKV